MGPTGCEPYFWGKYGIGSNLSGLIKPSEKPAGGKGYGSLSSQRPALTFGSHKETKEFIAL